MNTVNMPHLPIHTNSYQQTVVNMLNKVIKAQNTEASEDNVKTRDNY